MEISVLKRKRPWKRQLHTANKQKYFNFIICPESKKVNSFPDLGQDCEGYEGMGPENGIFIPMEDAFEYAIDRCINGPDREEFEKEFKETLVEWFYSGNWIKRKGECE